MKVGTGIAICGIWAATAALVHITVGWDIMLIVAAGIATVALADADMGRDE